MREFRLLHAPEHPSVNGGAINWVGSVALVLVKARSADGGVDHQDGNLLAFKQPLREFHAPPTQLRHFALLRFPDWVAPQISRRLFSVAGTPIAANPLVGFRRGFFAGVGGEGIGLAIDDVGIAADEIAHGV